MLIIEIGIIVINLSVIIFNKNTFIIAVRIITIIAKIAIPFLEFLNVFLQ